MVGTSQEDEPREERLGGLVRLNEEVAEVTEAAAEAAALALEAAEAARRARKRKRAEAAANRKLRTAPGTATVVRPAKDADEPTAPSSPPSEPRPAARQRRRNVISLRLDDDEFARVKQLAASTGLPLAAAARVLIVKGLDRGDET